MGNHYKLTEVCSVPDLRKKSLLLELHRFLTDKYVEAASAADVCSTGSYHSYFVQSLL